MRPNPQFPADLVTFTEEILNGKLHFSCSVSFTFDDWFYKWNVIILLWKANYDSLDLVTETLSASRNINSTYFAWKVSKYGYFSGLFFLAFRLNTRKYIPKKAPYLDIFHVVLKTLVLSRCRISFFSTQYMSHFDLHYRRDKKKATPFSRWNSYEK